MPRLSGSSREQERDMSEWRAVIDIGTNSVLLLLAR